MEAEPSTRSGPSPETYLTLLLTFQIFRIAHLSSTVIMLFIIFFGRDLPLENSARSMGLGIFVESALSLYAALGQGSVIQMMSPS